MLLVLSRLLSKWYWWIRHRLFDPYNIVRIKSLSPDYHDKDEIMMHACFQILVNFVEREKALEVIDWEWTEHHKFIGSEIRYLYKWWKEDRTKEWREYEQDWSFARGDALEEKDQTNLMRLIAIRESLWT